MKTWLMLLALGLATLVHAKDPADSAKRFEEAIRKMDSIESGLHYKTGKIRLEGNMATLNIPAGFKSLDAEEAKYVIEDVWGNLPGQSPLGLILPASSTATLADYAFIVEYQSIGYVKDDDAGEINYNELLEQMKKESAEANSERKEAGLETMDLLGWAAPPYYDKGRKVLHWAREYRVEGAEENTLNYDVRVLGRKGVLVLQAVSGMSALDSVNANINNILGMVSFNSGSQYEDFDPKTDDVAAWTIGGLVAGKLLVKAGFFAVVLKFLKFILLGLAAIGGGIYKWFKGRKKETAGYEAAAVPESANP